MMFEELVHTTSEAHRFLGLQMGLSLIRQDFPWIYDAGTETINVLRSRQSKDEKQKAIELFRRVLDFSFEHPMGRRRYSSKRMHMFVRELQHMLPQFMERAVAG